MLIPPSFAFHFSLPRQQKDYKELSLPSTKIGSNPFLSSWHAKTTIHLLPCHCDSLSQLDYYCVAHQMLEKHHACVCQVPWCCSPCIKRMLLTLVCTASAHFFFAGTEFPYIYNSWHFMNLWDLLCFFLRQRTVISAEIWISLCLTDKLKPHNWLNIHKACSLFLWFMNLHYSLLFFCRNRSRVYLYNYSIPPSLIWNLYTEQLLLQEQLEITVL